MAIRFSKEQAPLEARPQQMVSGAVFRGDLRRLRCSYDLAVDGAVTTSDQIKLATLPTGAVFAYGTLNQSASLGTSAVAIGTSAVHGSNGQFRAAAVKTSTNSPEVFQQVAAAAAAPSVAAQDGWLTVATASLPGSGTIVVDLYFSIVA